MDIPAYFIILHRNMSRRGKMLLAAGLSTSGVAVESQMQPSSTSSDTNADTDQVDPPPPDTADASTRAGRSHKRKRQEGVGAGDKFESTRCEVLDNFKCLNFVLNSFAKRRQAAVVDR